MAVKKTAAKATKAPAKVAKPAAKKAAAKKPVAKKAAPKAAAKTAKSAKSGIEVVGGGPMGVIVDEALKGKYYKAVQADIKTLFKQDEIDDTDINTLLCKTFVQGVIAGASIAADEAQKGFEDLAKMLQKLTKK
ncbi:MAG: hypothetical protein MJZ26_02905 [Fibrobacter sp.]|nr:hypothetical protein [Fibrobacter sp.]